jgi:hypothetical protein
MTQIILQMSRDIVKLTLVNILHDLEISPMEVGFGAGSPGYWILVAVTCLTYMC